MIHIKNYRNTFWKEGPDAVRLFCEQKDKKWKKCCTDIKNLENIVRNPDIDKIFFSSYYNQKKKHYRKDFYLVLDPNQKYRVSQGKREPGRSPLHYPDWQHRYHIFEELEKFLDKKINCHKDHMKWLTVVSESLPKDSTIDLQHLLDHHDRAIKKWTKCKEIASADPQSCLLPPLKKPHDVMHITALHTSGFLGEGAKVVVRECQMLDMHEAIRENLLLTKEQIEVNEKEKKSAVRSDFVSEGIDHATHVCGIIAAKPNATASLMCGVAPKAKLLPLVFTKDLNSEISIFNYSMGGAKSLALEIQAIDDTKLVIFGLGNMSVILDQNYEESDRPLDSENFCEKTILVIAVHADGVTPCTFTNFPGKTWADISLCAVGEKVVSTISDNKYDEMSGTSMATPFVSGVAALLKGKFPKLSSKEIRSCILESAIPILLDENHQPKLVESAEELATYSLEQIQLSRQYFGRGLLNGEGAMAKAQELIMNK